MNIGQLIAERGKPFYSFEFFPPKDGFQSFPLSGFTSLY